MTSILRWIVATVLAIGYVIILSASLYHGSLRVAAMVPCHYDRGFREMPPPDQAQSLNLVVGRTLACRSWDSATLPFAIGRP
jgi:hypothetical protein